MSFDLLVPGLLNAPAPMQIGDFAPALATLLSRATVTNDAAISSEDGLAIRLGSAAQSADFPFAAIAYRGETTQETIDGIWLRVDPVHFSINRDRVVLLDGSHLSITSVESEAIIDSFNSNFASDGLKFFAPHPQRWYVQSDQPIALRTNPPSVVFGRNVVDYWADGADRGVWQTRQSEMQMLLHAHPVNEARETAEQLAINGVWLWGAGELPAGTAAPYTCIVGDDALVTGLAAWMKIAHSSTARFNWSDSFSSNTNKTLVVLDSLASSSAYGDWKKWQATLVELERTWFAPALAQLKSGKLGCIRTIAPDPQHGKQFTTRRADLLKFWRRFQSL